jgi:hypothetical protein
MGKLNIIIIKEKAAAQARSGTSFLRTVFSTCFTATPIIGTITANIGTAVCGLKYPSGICIKPSPFQKTANIRTNKNAMRYGISSQIPSWHHIFINGAIVRGFFVKPFYNLICSAYSTQIR